MTRHLTHNTRRRRTCAESILLPPSDLLSCSSSATAEDSDSEAPTRSLSDIASCGFSALSIATVLFLSFWLVRLACPSPALCLVRVLFSLVLGKTDLPDER